jgi:prepilin-type N-terminal cleavage/methylation domain-containing protein
MKIPDLKAACGAGPGWGKRGFTLVEMLAAIAVLGLILLMLGQIFNSTMRATGISQKKMEAGRGAQAVLGTIQDDLDSLVRQNGSATVFMKPDDDPGDDSNNAKLLMVTHRRGSQGAPNSRYLAVSYDLDGTELRREVRELTWGTADLVGQAFLASDPAISGAVAEGILRFEAVLGIDNGRVVPFKSGDAWVSAQWNGASVPQSYYALALAGTVPDPAQQKISALTVAVAALDEKSLLLPGVSTMGSKLAAVGMNDFTPLDLWSQALDNGDLQAFPSPAVSALRFFQATFDVRP